MPLQSTTPVSEKVCTYNLSHLNQLVKKFEAGQVSKYFSEWAKLTSDPEILQTVAGDKITFDTIPPESNHAKACCVSKQTEMKMSKEVHDMLAKKIIIVSSHEQNEFLSPIFPRDKPDGGIRIILNLKKLNQYIEYLHFKMDNIKVILANVTKGCFMASIDLKQAYFSVKIDEEYQKYLKFQWQGNMYQFTCYPNGLAPCPRKFTKLMKVPLSYLRERRHLIVGYLDDFFLQAKSHSRCRDSVIASISLLQKLGFTVHPTKSQLDPSTTAIFLGFIIDSVAMTVSLTEEKKQKLMDLITTVLKKKYVKIRFVASLIGKMVSSFPGSLFGPLYYRSIEYDKNKALKENKGNYEKCMQLSVDATAEIIWWKENLPSMHAPVQWPPISAEINTDASGKNGWGACMIGRIPIGGTWMPDELDLHINVKEMLAVLYALRSYKEDIEGQHVRVLSDNSTTVFVLNKMGTTRSKPCNDLAKKIWEFCRDNMIYITCAHIPGVENIVADQESRREYKQGEWMLNTDIFKRAISHFQFQPNIDCFASRANAQLQTYVSRKPDPYATHVDAFSLNWGSYDAYIFPPFSLINRVLQKLRIDKATALCVFPRWTTQAWWPHMQELMVGEPLRIQPAPTNLILPNKSEHHPLHRKLELNICMLSGKNMH